MGIRQLKQQSRRDQLKIRRLQAQVNHSGMTLARPGTDRDREISLQRDFRECEAERVRLAQNLLKAEVALSQIKGMSRAKEARETAGAALVQIGK